MGLRASMLSRSAVSGSLRPHGLQPARLLCRWDFPGKNTGVGCHFLLQGLFLTQRANQFPDWQADSLPLSHQGSPHEWVQYPLLKRLQRDLLALLSSDDTRRVSEPESRFPPDTESASTLIQDFPASRTIRNKFSALYKPPPPPVFCYSTWDGLRHTGK